MKTPKKYQKKYHLIIRCKPARGYTTRIDLYSDDTDDLQKRIQAAKDFLEDRYIGYELYKVTLIEEG